MGQYAKRILIFLPFFALYSYFTRYTVILGKESETYGILRCMYLWFKLHIFKTFCNYPLNNSKSSSSFTQFISSKDFSSRNLVLGLKPFKYVHIICCEAKFLVPRDNLKVPGQNCAVITLRQRKHNVVIMDEAVKRNSILNNANSFSDEQTLTETNSARFYMRPFAIFHANYTPDTSKFPQSILPGVRGPRIKVLRHNLFPFWLYA